MFYTPLTPTHIHPNPSIVLYNPMAIHGYYCVCLGVWRIPDVDAKEVF